MTFVKNALNTAGDLWGALSTLFPMPFPLALLLALLICLANDYLAHYLAPAGIVLTPLVIVTITALLHTGRLPQQLLTAAFGTTLLICCHDVGIKLYAGGAHDAEGQGLSNFFLLPAHLLQTKLVRRTPGASLRQQRWALWAGPLLISGYLLCFGSLGSGRLY
jgi:hypothetical protein